MNVYQAERIILAALRKAKRKDELVSFDTNRYHHRPFGSESGYPPRLEIEHVIYCQQRSESYSETTWGEAVTACLKGEGLE